MDFNSKEKTIEQIKALNEIRSSYWKKSSEFKVEEFRDKVIHIMYKQKEYYDGEINDDYIPNGQGFLQFENGDYYIGDFVNGIKEGLGQYHYNDGIVYIGFWKADIKEGDGVVSNKKHSWEFTGKFKDDKPYEGFMDNYTGNANDVIDIENAAQGLEDDINNITLKSIETQSNEKNKPKNIITNEDVTNVLGNDTNIFALKSPVFKRQYNSRRFYSTKDKTSQLP